MKSPCSPMAEATDLKSVKFRFESEHGELQCYGQIFSRVAVQEICDAFIAALTEQEKRERSEFAKRISHWRRNFAR
jgi:hypothetical protein